MTGEPLSKSEFWSRVAAFAFATWAVMIPIGIAMIRESLNNIAAVDKAQDSDQAAYKLTIERRLTTLEINQQRVLATIGEHHSRIDENERRIELLNYRQKSQK